MSNLWTLTNAFMRCNLAKLWADILLRFQWQIERASFSLRLDSGFTSTLPLRDKIKQKQGAACCFLIHYPWEKIRQRTVTKNSILLTEIKGHATLVLFLYLEVITLSTLVLFTIFLLSKRPAVPRYWERLADILKE